MVAQIDQEYKKIKKTKIAKRLISYIFFEGRPLTTRGRWINRILRLLYGLFRFIPFTLLQRPNIVFIAGTGRSGTTYLGKLLSCHHDVGFLNEPKLIWSLVNPSDDVVGNYRSSGEPSFRIRSKKSVNWLFLKTFYSVYSTAVNSPIVVDKYPEIIYRISPISESLKGSKFLIILRCPYETAASIENWSHRLGTAHADWWGENSIKWHLMVRELVPQSNFLRGRLEEITLFGDQKMRALIEWILAAEEALNIVKCKPQLTLLVRYEDLQASPDLTMTRINDFLGLSFDKDLVGYLKSSIVKPKQYDAYAVPKWMELIIDDLRSKIEVLSNDNR